MPVVKRLVLDVLKPHRPNALELAKAIATLSQDYQVSLTITAVDEKTESAEVIIKGNDLNFDTISNIISTMGGSVHSIDVVEVEGGSTNPESIVRNEINEQLKN